LTRRRTSSPRAAKASHPDEGDELASEETLQPLDVPGCGLMPGPLAPAPAFPLVPVVVPAPLPVLAPPAPLPVVAPDEPVELLLAVEEPDPLLVLLLLEPGVQSWMQSPVVAVPLVAQQEKPAGQAVVCEQTGALAGKPVLTVGSKQP
jgi:hypothetical protein